MSRPETRQEGSLVVPAAVQELATTLTDHRLLAALLTDEQAERIARQQLEDLLARRGWVITAAPCTTCPRRQENRP